MYFNCIKSHRCSSIPLDSSSGTGTVDINIVYDEYALLMPTGQHGGKDNQEFLYEIILDSNNTHQHKLLLASASVK